MTQDRSNESPYETYRELIEQVIAASARHHRLQHDVAAEFSSFVWERLLSSDRLGRFEGRCSLRTFLTVVVRNLYRDFRNHQWGKWRHSEAARRLGPVALKLELLMSRDGYTFEEAVNTLVVNAALPVTRDELYAISTKLPARARRRMVGEEALADVSVPSDTEERTDWAGDRRVKQIQAYLRRAMEGLAAQDQLILKLIFLDGFPVSDVAKTLRLEQKSLYRKRDVLLRALRHSLESAGVNSNEARQFLAELSEEGN